MSSKIKRNFLIAATPGDTSWYRALSEKELTKAAHPDEALFVERPLEGATTLGAPDKYNLLHMTLPASEGMKNDLAKQLAAEIVKRPDALAGVVNNLTAEEQFQRSLNLKPAQEDALYDQFGFEDAERRMSDLAFLRQLPDTNYNMSEHLLTLMANGQVADGITAVIHEFGGTPAEKQKDIEDLFKQLDGASVIRWANAYGFHYGDPFNDYEGPYRDEAKAYFDVAKSLMQHWDEAGKTPSGKPYDAFAAGHGAKRSVFVKGDFVKKLQPKAP